MSEWVPYSELPSGLERETSLLGTRQPRPRPTTSSELLEMETGSDTEDGFIYEGVDPRAKRSETEKRLCVVLLVCLLLTVALLVALMAVSFTDQSESEACTSTDCVTVAGSMLSKMDLTADPCQDFYTYACGLENRDPLIPPSEKKWGVFQKVEKRNMAIVRKLLEVEGAEYNGQQSTAVTKAKIYYNTCMNATSRESVSTNKLLQVINDLGSWPLTSDPISGQWDPATWDLEKVLGKLYFYESSLLFGSQVSADDKNSSVQRIVFDQGGTLYSNPDYYKANDTTLYRDAYIQLFVSVVTQLGADETAARTAGNNVYQLEEALAKAFDPPEARVDPQMYYHRIPVTDLQDLLKSNKLNFGKYLNEIFQVNIPETTDVLVYAIDYFPKLGVILEAADKETLATYTVWHAVVKMLPFMPLALRMPLQELERTLSGVEGQGELWVQCLESTQGALGFVTGALYVEDNFSPQDKLTVQDVLGEVRQSFIANLPSVTWMDKATQSKAIVKANSMTDKIGYPPFIKDPTELDKYYEAMNIINGTSFENAINVWQWSAQRNINKYGKPTDKLEWDMYPDMVNAYYSPPNNQMVFPAGILQSPFYDEMLPKSVIYGALGMVMGHELSHGFDNQGRLFDVDGNLHNWWTNESATGFLDKTQCLVDQYSQFEVVPGVMLNGKTTLGENIADNAGIKTAFRAYHAWASKADYYEHPLPGLNMTQDQLFYLSFSQLWCSYYTPEYAKTSVVTDVHSYAKYRVIGTLQNQPEFAAAFSCPQNSPLNPDKKCSVW